MSTTVDGYLLDNFVVNDDDEEASFQTYDTNSSTDEDYEREDESEYEDDKQFDNFLKKEKECIQHNYDCIVYNSSLDEKCIQYNYNCDVHNEQGFKCVQYNYNCNVYNQE
jgi:hypothetical protein